jgi:hypothetical protein
MKNTIVAAIVAVAAGLSFSAPAYADSVKIIVKPRVPVVKKVVIRKPCYTKTVKEVRARKTIITKKRVCP